MSTLHDHLDDLDPAPPVRALATDLAGWTSVESDRQAQYVSLRPSTENAVAVYAHKTWISIALSPERALQVVGEVPGATLDNKTPATTYLHVAADSLGDRYAVVLGIAKEAMGWRATGPKSSVGTGSPKKGEQASKICPACQMELLPSGACGACW
ncbi:hypothetical protein ACI782_06915 [Geodermatophilus sp. SYSU D00703]